MPGHIISRCIALAAAFALVACQDSSTTLDVAGPSFAKGGIPGPPAVSGETAGSNLSFPTIWAEGISKNPRGAMGDVTLGGAWWYWWGEPLEENGESLSCGPDPDDSTRCDDGVADEAGGPVPGEGWVKAYLQKDAANEWQADNADGSATPVLIERIDWGDAIESVAWTLASKVRIEATLFEDLATPMTGYTMHHTSGHGIDEMWGVDGGRAQAGAALTYESPEAMVFSSCARLTIQKLRVSRDVLDPLDERLTWNSETHLWEGDPISVDPIFNGAIAPEGPGGGFGAEINIQGKVVYGMTWDVKTSNDGDGDYRLTFSLADENCATATLNTFITSATEIVRLEEEGEISIASESSEGGVAYVDGANNLTYIDIRITPKETGGGGGGGHHIR